MSILMWDAPKKLRTPQENAEHYGFEEGPTGGYIPNMSEADARRWKGKITGKNRGVLQAELRKSFDSAQVTIIVTLDGGYTYNHYTPAARPHLNTHGVQIHMATNGPIRMSFDDLAEMNAAIGEAKDKLKELTT
ncbi:MAG: hypothetical protein EOP83_01635 [Verrucomicrobiaceae bacterium]|nr:MAG: hypothetical protein EOP83_01635 [Verrucomicrobiaceae bacterium]